ncbi:hypothetical protein [Verrucomicrobium sp. BvORR106]|uniref:hypothetical protein n=1 Tax=Verrucomicrobium sp. BvORR106 TaxID=1403819 RepID=UPI00056F36B1|nr:hypothetical protein [Verrucomicrobium sp. BvORR106]
MKSTFQTFLLHALLLCSGSHGAAVAAPLPEPATALVILSRSGTTDQYSSALEISKVEFESAVALKVLLPDGQSSSIPKNQVGLIYRYADPMVVLAGAGDVKTLSAKRAEAVGLANRFPRAKVYIDRVIAQLDSDIQKLSSGQVRYRGVWQAAATGTVPDRSSRSITVNGVIYVNPQVSRLDNGGVMLKHDGGVVRVSFSEATTDLLRLVRANTDLFAGMEPLKSLALHDRKITGAILVGLQENRMTVLCDDGVLLLDSDDLTSTQIAALTSSNRTISARATVTARPTPEAVQGNLLPLGPGTGDRDPELGWACTAEERKAWEQAAVELFSEPPGINATFQDLISGRLKPGPEIPAPIPRYEEITQFINSKMDAMTVGYSKVNKRFVLRGRVDQSEVVLAVFDAKDLGTLVTAKTFEDGVSVVLEGRDGKNAFTSFTQVDGEGSNPGKLWRDQSAEVLLRVRNPEDAPRVARAFTTLIFLAGGRASQF